MAKGKSDKRKWVILSIVLTVVIVAMILMPLTNLYTDWNKYCVFGHDYDENGVCTRNPNHVKLDDIKPDEGDKGEGKEPPKDEEQPGVQSGVRGGPVVSTMDLVDNGVNVAVAPLAAGAGVSQNEVANSYVLTASIKPASADDKTVDWAIRWKNAESEWAKGKNVEEHCTITPESDGSLKATLRCLKDFGEQIEVVVTSRDNPEKQAICLVDYVQKITGFTFNMPDITSETTSFTYQVETTAYTIKSESVVTFGSTMSLSDAFKAKFRELFKKSYSIDFDTESINDGAFIDALLAYSSNQITLSFDSDAADQATGCAPGDINNPLVSLFITCRDSWNFYDNGGYRPDYNLLTIVFRETINALVSGAHANFEITYQATYNGQVYSTGSKIVDARFDGTVLHVPVEDLTLNTDHVIF